MFFSFPHSRVLLSICDDCGRRWKMMGRMNNCFNNFFVLPFFGRPKVCHLATWNVPASTPPGFLSLFLYTYCTFFCCFFKILLQKKKHIQPGRVGKTWKIVWSLFLNFIFKACCWARRRKKKYNSGWMLVECLYRPLFRAFSSSLNKLCELPLCFSFVHSRWQFPSRLFYRGGK